LGSPPLLTAGAAFVEMGVVAVSVAAFFQTQTVPWRVVETRADDDEPLGADGPDEGSDDDFVDDRVDDSEAPVDSDPTGSDDTDTGHTRHDSV